MERVPYDSSMGRTEKVFIGQIFSVLNSTLPGSVVFVRRIQLWNRIWMRRMYTAYWILERTLLNYSHTGYVSPRWCFSRIINHWKHHWHKQLAKMPTYMPYKLLSLWTGFVDLLESPTSQNSATIKRRNRPLLVYWVCLVVMSLVMWTGHLKKYPTINGKSRHISTISYWIVCGAQLPSFMGLLYMVLRMANGGELPFQFTPHHTIHRFFRLLFWLCSANVLRRSVSVLRRFITSL